MSGLADSPVDLVDDRYTLTGHTYCNWCGIELPTPDTICPDIEAHRELERQRVAV